MTSGRGALIVGSATISVGPESIGLLSRARGLLQGMTALTRASGDVTTASHFLACWTLELLLKSYLSHVGVSKKELNPIRHNLEALWTKASSLGLAVSDSPPRWCQLLNGIHDYPYYSRYPTTAAGYVGPNLQQLNADLGILVSVVSKVVQPG